MSHRSQGGFTLIELLVTLSMLSLISVGFYQVLFSSSRGVDTAQNAIAVSEEARLGFNRLIRDTRESQTLINPTATSFTVSIDFDRSGGIVENPPDGPALGNFEILKFTFIPSIPPGNGTITVSGVGAAAGLSEVLMQGVDCVRNALGACLDVFSYASSRLEYDGLIPSVSPDGRSSAAEVEAALDPTPDGVLDTAELRVIDIVEFALVVRIGEASETFYAEAQIRNQR